MPRNIRQAPVPLERGNINLKNRPVVRNKDGTVSTVRTIGINTGNREVVIPTVSDRGRVMTNREAIKQYRTSGRHFGAYRTVEEASAAAQQLHLDQAAMHSRKQAKPSSKSRQSKRK